MFSVLFSMYLGMVFVLILVPSTLIYHKLGRFRKGYKKMIFIFISCFFISCINFILSRSQTEVDLVKAFTSVCFLSSLLTIASGYSLMAHLEIGMKKDGN